MLGIVDKKSFSFNKSVVNFPTRLSLYWPLAKSTYYLSRRSDSRERQSAVMHYQVCAWGSVDKARTGSMFWCLNFFLNKFNSRLDSQTFLKFRAEHKWDRSLFSWDWLRKADASDHSASIDISASAPIDISIKCRDTPSHFSKGLLSRSIAP